MQMSDQSPTASPRPLAVKAFGITDTGKVRKTNEDQFLVAELTKSMRVWQTSLPEPKVQYGSGCLLRRGKGWAIRWREIEIAPDGTRRKVLRYEALGEVTRKQASETLNQRVTAAGNRKTPTRSHVTFRTLAGEWDATVLPMYTIGPARS